MPLALLFMALAAIVPLIVVAAVIMFVVAIIQGIIAGQMKKPTENHTMLPANKTCLDLERKKHSNIKVVAWNIMSGGGPRISSILASIIVHSPYIVVLSEFRNNSSGATIKQRLSAQGFQYQKTSVAEPNVNSVFVASKIPFISSRQFRLPNQPLSLVKWRSAEQQILSLFNTDGWSATDVSRQNVGYDIEATDANGRQYYIEVKSINFAGQEFSFTSNEEATAREKGDSYIIALVLQQSEQLSVMLIENPTSVLKFERQCKQWVWLCTSYDFTPENYKFE